MAIHHALAAPLFLALFLTLPDGRAVKAETIRLTLKNGDTINAELVPDESTDERKVVMHPQLGRPGGEPGCHPTRADTPCLEILDLRRSDREQQGWE